MFKVYRLRRVGAAPRTRARRHGIGFWAAYQRGGWPGGAVLVSSFSGPLLLCDNSVHTLGPALVEF
eukprot:2968624-Prymnesium_polylepis.3